MSTQELAESGQEITYAYLKQRFSLLKSDSLPIGAWVNGTCRSCGHAPAVRLKSEGWTSSEFCPRCKGINIILHQDPMSGAFYDALECFVTKP